jgi:hypothetical protein
MNRLMIKKDGCLSVRPLKIRTDRNLGISHNINIHKEEKL